MSGRHGGRRAYLNLLPDEPSGIDRPVGPVLQSAVEVGQMAKAVAGKGGFGGKKAPLSGGAEVSFAPIPEGQLTPLRRFLEDQGIKIGELANGCNVGKPYMNRIVNGRRNPSLGLAARVAAYLGVSLDKVSEMLKPQTREYKR